MTAPSHVARCWHAWESHLRPRVTHTSVSMGRAMLFWSGPVLHGHQLGPALEVSVSWGLGGWGAAEVAVPLGGSLWTGSSHLCHFQRPCGRPVGELPPPPQRTGQRPSSSHQAIIFTNLQVRKRVHSGPNSPGQEPCGKAEGTGAGQRRSRPEATSCLSWASLLRLQTRPQPLRLSRHTLPRSRDSERPSALATSPSGLPVGSCLPPTLISPAEHRPLWVPLLLPTMPFLILPQRCRDSDRT